MNTIQKKNCKIYIVFDDMIVDILNNKTTSTDNNRTVYQKQKKKKKKKKMNIALAQSYFAVQKNIRLNSTLL